MKRIRTLFGGRASSAHTSGTYYSNRQEEKLRVLSRLNASESYDFLRSSERGLSQERVAESRRKYGKNMVSTAGALLSKRFVSAFINPFAVILLVLAAVYGAAELFWMLPEERNLAAVSVIAGMVAGCGILRFIQESRSGSAADRLSDMIRRTACVRRREADTGLGIPMEEIVVGDIILLKAGDMVPADLRILEADGCYVNQAPLTGECAPVEKTPAIAAKGKALTDISCLVFAGSTVVSGSAMGIAAAVGDGTLLGSIAGRMNTVSALTPFGRSVNSLFWICIRFFLIMIPVVFVLNGLVRGGWGSTALFAVFVALGLAPELLARLVSTAHARGFASIGHNPAQLSKSRM